MKRLGFSLNHVGIFVIDIDQMSDFYTDFLGFVISDRRDDPNPIQFLTLSPDEHHQLLLVAGRKPDSPSTVAQISFLMPDFAQLRALHERAQTDPRIEKIWSLDHGNSWTVYFRDPEDNIVECYVHTPWHVAQPYGTPIDFSLSDEEIYRRTETASLANPSYMASDAYRAKMALLLGEQAQ
jgi:catechol 2,3-dioxygenase